MQNGWNLDFDFIMNEQETPANSKISPARVKLMLLVHYDTFQCSTCHSYRNSTIEKTIN
jgi:hypothetical protein